MWAGVCRLTGMNTLPGVPPLVVEAQQVVARRNSTLLRWMSGGGGLGAPLIVLGVTFDVGALFLAGVLAFAAGVGLAFLMNDVTDPQLLDAWSVLSQWADVRDAWAREAVVASMDASIDDVRAFSEAAPQLQQLRGKEL